MDLTNYRDNLMPEDWTPTPVFKGYWFKFYDPERGRFGMAKLAGSQILVSMYGERGMIVASVFRLRDGASAAAFADSIAALEDWV